MSTSVEMKRDLEALDSASLEEWMRRHNAAIDAGVNVGQIQRDKAQTIRLILIKRDVATY